MGQRPVLRAIPALAEGVPLRPPVRRRGQPLLKRTDDRVLRGVEQPVGADQVEPGVALAEGDDQGEEQPPGVALRLVLQKTPTSVKIAVFSVRKNVLVSDRRWLIRSAIST